MEKLQKQLESLQKASTQKEDPEGELQDDDYSDEPEEPLKSNEECDSMCETEVNTETEDESDNEGIPEG